MSDSNNPSDFDLEDLDLDEEIEKGEDLIETKEFLQKREYKRN
jgi:hypothetical protein